MSLFPVLEHPPEREAIRFGHETLSYRQLGAIASAAAERLEGSRRVAVWALPELGTCAAVVAALSAGVPVVPINPNAGERELEHIVRDSRPDAVLAADTETLPDLLSELRRIDVGSDPRERGELRTDLDDDAPAIIIYTSGTTGPPKGAVLPRRAIASNLDALAAAWEWTAQDRLVHALPLFHVHGLVLGVLGPVRLGGHVRHLGRFSPEAVAEAFTEGATLLFGVPTMYHRLIEAAQASEEVARALAGARLLVSGSAALPAREHERMAEVTGQRIVERYGMTETLMNCSVRAAGDRRPGYVGPPLDGIRVQLLDDAGQVIEVSDDETIGELAVSGPNLFLEYLNRPEATAEVMRGGWFMTGDLATRAPDGYVRIVGRRSTDLIKSGGYKIGAGEIEGALREHPQVRDAAVTGEPDPDLGERIVAWVVPAGDAALKEQPLIEHVARLLSPHKRPRAVRFVAELPRNEMGKVQKKRLGKQVEQGAPR
jgi:malonyl-CoA/methylmalonyl-CoA synthetase